MFAFVLQSLTSLLLAAVFVYGVFTSKWLRKRERLQQLLLGIIFGVMVISLGMNSISYKLIPTQFDAKAGPLIFAGYLGGPIGGLIAGLCGALYRVSFGGPATGIGVFMNCGTAALGVAAFYIRPSKKWPSVDISAIAFLIPAFALLHLVPFWYLGKISDALDGFAEPAQIVTAFFFIGTLSILVTWQILVYALHFADSVNRADELANKLDFAMQASGLGMFDHQRGDDGPYFDDAMMSIYGLDRAPGMVPIADWKALIHPDDLPRIQASMQRTWAGNNDLQQMDFRAFRPDGTLRYIHASWTIERDSDGTVNRVTGMHADLTDIRLAEQQHKTSAERLALIAEKLPGAIIETDFTDMEKPTLLYVSPRCLEIWGYTDEELLADVSLLPKSHDAEDLGAFIQALENGLRTGEDIHYRYRITARDGKSKWLDFHGSPANDDGRTLLKAIVLDATREVEAQKQVEKEREISRRAQRNESIGQLTGGVAHDFNNLLAVIMGNLELLRMDDDPASQHELIDAAITATLRGADLTKNMLAFARKAPLKPVVLDLNDVVREAKNWIVRTLPESVQVETSLLAGLWPVQADRASLESALLNLTLNARDAMHGQGSLTIETANVRIDQAYIDSRNEELAPGRYVMLAVSDDGDGIPDDVIDSIFEPFFTTKPPGLGSGLGLSMTVGFMRQSGGTIQIYTEVGQGTTFKLYFPAATVPLEQQHAPAITVEQSGDRKTKLLVAEDEDAVRTTLVKILERANYQVTATSSGDAAYDIFKADPTYDLLLTDIVMPGELQGTGLAKALRERWPDLPVIFMSGYASEATVHGNGLRPEDIRLMKPVQRADLLAALEQGLSGS